MRETAKILRPLGIIYYRSGECDLGIEYYAKDMEVS